MTESILSEIHSNYPKRFDLNLLDFVVVVVVEVEVVEVEVEVDKVYLQSVLDEIYTDFVDDFDYVVVVVAVVEYDDGGGGDGDHDDHDDGDYGYHETSLFL